MLVIKNGELSSSTQYWQGAEDNYFHLWNAKSEVKVEQSKQGGLEAAGEMGMPHR